MELFNRSDQKPPRPPRTAKEEAGAAAVIFNVFILLINVLHLIILRRLYRSKKTAYIKILAIMAINDILFSLYAALFNINQISKLLESNQMIEELVRTGTDDVAHVMKFEILIAAAYDRYMAICQPFSYGSNFVTRRIISVLTAAMIVTTAVLVTVHGLSFVEQTSYNANNWHIYFVYLYKYGFINAMILGIMIMSGLVFKELWRMRSRPLSSDDKAARNGMIHVMVTTGILIITVLPNFVYKLYEQHSPVPPRGSKFHGIKLFGRYTFFSYGLLNVICYGALNSAYRSELRRLLPSKNNAVHA